MRLRSCFCCLLLVVLSACARREPAPQAAPSAPAATDQKKRDAVSTTESEFSQPPPPSAPSDVAAEPEATPGLVVPNSAAPASGAIRPRDELKASKPKRAAAEAPATDSPTSLGDDQDLLERDWRQLKDSLSAPERDCSGAGLHQRAICDIAERICTLLDEGVYRAAAGSPQQTCSAARAKCDRAKGELQDRCD